MITKERKVEKLCSFYASEFHLEMIMLPYINKKISENAKIIIMTEKDLKDTIKIVISKINLPEDKKNQILSLGWNKDDCNKFKQIRKMKDEKELIIFIIGNENYIKNVNKNIEKAVEDNNVKIIDCYDLKDIENKFEEILSKYSRVLNTSEEKKISKNY